MAKNHGTVVADAWEEMMRTHEDPMRASLYLFSEDPRSYRERLDARKINYYGEAIPRIDIVRQNLAALKAGNMMRWRGLDVRDRRQSPERRR